jgi:hypothetical protein
MPDFIDEAYLPKVDLSTLIQILSGYNTNKPRVLKFLDFLAIAQKDKHFFIQSEKDLINFMTLNVKFPNNFEVDILMTQIVFFD